MLKHIVLRIKHKTTLPRSFQNPHAGCPVFRAVARSKQYCNVNFFEVIIDFLQVIVRVFVEIIRLFEIIIACLSSNILSTNPVGSKNPFVIVGSNKSIYRNQCAHF
jgi:hypothetical protein